MTKQKSILSLLALITLSVFAILPRAVHAELPVGNYCNFYPIEANYGNVSGDITLNNNCVVYEDVNGVANGDMIVDGSSITLHKTLVWYPEKKITILNQGKIWVNTNGRIVQSKLCVKDTNNNRYPGVISITVDPYGQGVTTTLTQLDQQVADARTLLCPAGYNYRETMLSLSYADANDSDMTKSAGLATSDHDLLARGFWVAGVKDANAAGNPVKLIGDNLLICTSAPCDATFGGASDYGNAYINNKVGIGLTVPLDKLHINGNMRSGTSYYGYVGQVNNDLIIASNGDQNYRLTVAPINGGTGNIVFKTAAFASGDTERMRIRHDGNVGIGTNAPATKLDVAGTGGPALRISDGGDFVITAQVSGNNTSMYNDTGTLTINTPVSATSFVGALTGNASTATTLIGSQSDWANYRTNAVANMLSWKNYGNGHIIFDASNSTSPTGAAVNSTNSQIAWSASYPTLMGWNGANTYGVRVDSARLADTATNQSGGTVAATTVQLTGSGLLNSRGQQIIQGDASDYFRINQAGTYTNGTAAYGNWQFGSGNVAMGTWTPSATYKLYVVGTFYAGGSSREYKENIVPLTLDSSKIYQLNPVSYDYKDKYKDLGKKLSGGRQFGLIAEEVFAVYPELALSDGTKNVANVDYEKLGVLIIAEMKNQKTELDALKVENQQLKDKLNSIELRLQKLENN